MIKTIVLSIEIREEQVGKFREAIMQLEKQFNIAIGLDLVEKVNNKLELDSYLSDLFASLGMSASLSGYNYLKSAINLVMSDSTYLQRGITSRLYPDVASTFGTKPHCVERAIRHAITTVWNNGNFALLEQNFGSCISASTGKPTNSAFIARAVELTKIELNQKIS